jgi:cytochrome c-type biogenesis protein CcmH/NrfF
MHDGGWFGMAGMGLYWQLPVLFVVLVFVAWFFARRRAQRGR